MEDGMPRDDESAIAQRLAAYVHAWNQGNLERWSEFFAERSDFVTWAGLWWKTRADNLAGHRAMPDVVRAQLSNYRAEIAGIDFLTSDVALIHITWSWPSFLSSAEARPQDRHGIITMIMARHAGEWLIRASHNSLGQ
jgi:uncharacterized protein (TIGR02246 family)